MNIKSGIDLVAINRIQKDAQNPQFTSRILTPTEQQYVRQKQAQSGSTNQSIANTIGGLFAAKEAVSKALGTGLLNGIGFADITIDHQNGAPVVLLSKKAQKLLSKPYCASVSISHDGGFAIAVCTIIEY